MSNLRCAAMLAAGAALALSPAPVAAQAAGQPTNQATAQPARKPGLFGAQIKVTEEGPKIAAVLPDRTAAAIGVKVGDILLEAGSKPISLEALQAISEAGEGGGSSQLQSEACRRGP